MFTMRNVSLVDFIGQNTARGARFLLVLFLCLIGLGI